MADMPGLRFAVNARREWVEIGFVGLENPHVLIVGGSRSGKTTLLKLIVAVAASQGFIVIVLDPKLRIGKWFEGVPHVRTYRHENSAIAAVEAEGALRFVQDEQQRRYRLDDVPGAYVLADERRFPPILLVCDEFRTLVSNAQDEWPSRRPRGGRGDSPTERIFPNLMRMGAEARIFTVTATHTAHAEYLPAGVETRSLCGNRIVLGTDREVSNWTMIAGPGVVKPSVPERQKGAGVFLFGAREPMRVQVAEIRDHELVDLAMRGLPGLRAAGHVTEDGQLLLGDVVLPRPGHMASHVAAAGSDAGAAGETFGAGQPVGQTDAGPVVGEALPGAGRAVAEMPPPIVGLAAAAEFCGMTYSNFRKHRERQPIGGEFLLGTSPAWQVADLREWAIYRSENRRRRRRGDGEAA